MSAEHERRIAGYPKELRAKQKTIDALVAIIERARTDLILLAVGANARSAREAVNRIDEAGARLP